MRNYRCRSCGRHYRGRGKRWGGVFPLCGNCYAYHCKNIVKRSKVEARIRRSLRPTTPIVRGPSLWRRIFG